MRNLRVGLVQMKVNADKGANLSAALKHVEAAAAARCEIVCLPEMFSTPYSNSCFPEYAEPAGGPTCQRLSRIAREQGVWLIGGSIPERDGARLYNTSFVFNPQGEMVARHRKVHLFDIDIEGGIRFMESETLSPGASITVFETEQTKVGLAICFDIRFPEQMRLMADGGAEVIFIPAAFNMTTGPAHWHLTSRMRALDNQVYVACVSPARSDDGPYVAYGHSLVADPWGTVIAEAGSEETVLVVDLDLDRVQKLRQELPLLKARRRDLYLLENVNHSAERK